MQNHHHYRVNNNNEYPWVVTRYFIITNKLPDKWHTAVISSNPSKHHHKNKENVLTQRRQVVDTKEFNISTQNVFARNNHNNSLCLNDKEDSQAKNKQQQNGRQSLREKEQSSRKSGVNQILG